MTIASILSDLWGGGGGAQGPGTSISTSTSTSTFYSVGKIV